MNLLKLKISERRDKRERIQFLDCYSLKHATNGSTALLQRRRKQFSIKLPDGLDEAVNMVKKQGFFVIRVV